MYKVIKRTADFVSALMLLIVISPAFLALAVLVRVRIGSPVFFEQIRSGKNGKPFKIRKFRTMTEEKDENGVYLPDEKRLTRLGRALRGTSLDEIPELISIIKGNMSVIGPRPLPPYYDDYYTEREQKRFLVRGGLIPPEVLFHNVQPTWEEQLEYEAWYAENVSLKLDLAILFAVFKGLFTRYKDDYGEYVRGDFAEERRRERENDSVYSST
ncbi:MAG: sugar transferase [Clostridia bacterium]|nr:sugar transferase [Clostridia bacterium]